MLARTEQGNFTTMVSCQDQGYSLVVMICVGLSGQNILMVAAGTEAVSDELPALLCEHVPSIKGVYLAVVVLGTYMLRLALC